MFAVICSQGQMRFRHIQQECREEAWAPIVVAREEGKPPMVLILPSDDAVRKFTRRNFPKNWMCGSIRLSDLDIQTIRDNAWGIEHLPYARKITDRQLDIEVLQLADEPDVFFGYVPSMEPNP